MCSAGRQHVNKKNNELSGFFRSAMKAPIRRLFEPLVGKSQESSVKYLLLSTPLGPVLLSLLSLETSWIAVSKSHITDAVNHPPATLFLSHYHTLKMPFLRALLCIKLSLLNFSLTYVHMDFIIVHFQDLCI